LFKKSKIKFNPKIKIITDTGYQGIQKLHINSEVPKKRSKKFPLMKEDRDRNRKISSARMPVENVIGSIKKFRIVSETYRNRRKRFSLRFNLISGIYNFELMGREF